ncbi:MAG: DUF488 domain-containing protein [Ignavibacteria bacterium]
MNNAEQNKIIWTIGHSTRTFAEFISILHSFQIELLVDIRSYPGSRRYPHFNKEILEVTLPENDIQYIHLKELGGRRKTLKDSHNTGWRLAAFRGYADYMETEQFVQGINELERLASVKRTAYMCSEVLWWRCHRSLVSDYLKLRGWRVIHVIRMGKNEEHSYTSPARVVKGKLLYTKDLQLF